MSKIAIALLTTVGTCALSAGASAQDVTDGADGAGADNAIIVTAQRKAEKVTEVPISITVAGQDQLERQQVNTVTDLSRVAPSLEIMGGQGNSVGGGGVVRGIGTQTFSAGAQAAVGIVVDQVPQGNVNISDLFDVSRVEVLKGPQGTLFGLTTSAGVINITTNVPDTSKASMRIAGELSDGGTAGSIYGQQVLKGVVNVPLADNAAVRVSAVQNLTQGPQHNNATGEDNEAYRRALRARLLWEPTDALTVNLIGDYAWVKYHGVNFFTTTDVSGAGVPAAYEAALAACGIVAQDGNTDYCQSDNSIRRETNYGLSLQADYDVGPFTFSSISSYRGNSEDQNIQNIFRVDGAPLNLFNGPVDTKTEQFAQELRIQSPSTGLLEYTAGVFYSWSKNVQQPRTFYRRTVTNGITRTSTLRSRGLITIHDESYAAFGQATFHATDFLRLIAGARYTVEKLSYDESLRSEGASQKSKEWSWRLGAQYDITPATMAYATANRGFKGGQVDVPQSLTQDLNLLEPETPMAYELGLKSTLFRSWVLDLNAFYTKVNNFQAQSCATDGNAGNFVCSQTNLDYIKSRGAEINVFGKVNRNLSLNTGFIYARTTYPTGMLGNDNTSLSGQQLAFAPRYKFTMSGEYEQPVSDNIAGFLAVDTVWKSRIRYQQTTREVETFKPHWTVGGRVGLRDLDERYSIAIFARNLFNVHEPITIQTNSGANDVVQAMYGPAAYRQVGLSFDAKF